MSRTSHPRDLVAAPRAARPPAVGISAIDEQHAELAARLSSLKKGIVSGDRSEVNGILDFLNRHVVDSFGLEESWMAEMGFPDSAGHKAEHDAFMQEYLRFFIEVERRGPTALAAMRICNWLTAWLEQHVGRSDRALRGFLLAQSPRCA